MQTLPKPAFLSRFWQDSFDLKQHIQEFLQIDSKTLEMKLKAGQQEMADLGHKDFDWEKATNFYSEKVKELYLFELGAWHLASYEYIGNTLLLVADQAQGRVLDFGGGIGTHTIGAALSPQVDKVFYCDINPININFVQHRVKQLGLNEKVIFCSEIPLKEKFETIISFDVLEHLPDPSQQLLDFYQALTPEGRIILNWCFFKGFNQEHPFHLDDPQAIENYFRTLQSNFLEVFHPYHITARSYRKEL